MTIIETKRMKIELMFLWYDFWVGVFWDTKKRILYVNPLPCVVFKFSEGNKSDNS